LADDKLPTHVLPSWPVVVGLGIVALLVAGMIGLDLHFEEEQAMQTTDIIEGAQQSIVLLNKIRFDANRLVRARNERDIERLRQEIARHSRLYDPAATHQGEREEWNRLQDLLRRLPVNDVADSEAARRLDEGVERSVDALVNINTAAGQGNLAAIRAAQRQAIWSDAGAGAIVLLVVTLISAWLLRVLARQRRLVLRQVQFLDEKNAELAAFAGRAAHDLRSPMNPIRGYADLILETPSLPENVSSMAQRIRRSVDRMARVVDDMLALSVSGRPPEGISASSMVVERVLEEMGPDLQGTEVVTKLAGGQVRCAEGTLSQILRNLVGNAMKFRSRSRPLRIVVETRDVGPTVELAVEDNGVGMDQASARHVFEPFYRGASEREVPGHGLGLAIVERMTRALGGSCELTSVLDRGTRIVVRLPRV
jgi:two-component system phosphate regulon sensor histidine kinase PhoR